MGINCTNNTTELGVHEHDTAADVRACWETSRPVQKGASLTEVSVEDFGNETVTVPVRETSQIFAKGEYNVTITEVHLHKNSKGNPWVRLTMECGDFKRPIFSNITVAGNSLAILDTLHFRLNGIRITNVVDEPTVREFLNFIVSLKGLTVKAWVREDRTDEGRTILQSSMSTWKKATV